MDLVEQLQDARRQTTQRTDNMWSSLSNISKDEQSLGVIVSDSEELAKSIINDCLSPLTNKLNLLRNLVTSNERLDIQTGLTTQIANKFTHLDNLSSTLETRLTTIKDRITERLRILTAALENAAELKREDLVKGIISIQIKLESQLKLLETTIAILIITKEYNAKMGISSKNYFQNICTNCQNDAITNTLMLISKYLTNILINKGLRTTLAQTAVEITNVIQMI